MWLGKSWEEWLEIVLAASVWGVLIWTVRQPDLWWHKRWKYLTGREAEKVRDDDRGGRSRDRRD